MGLLSLTLPTIGQPNSTEDSKVRDALSAIQTEFNGNIELTNIAPGLQELFIPTATVLPYASGTAPSGFLICDGAEISRGTYSALFTKIGEEFGVGDGSTTFNLPDLRGRMPVGKGTHADVDTLGENDGTAVANRRPKHWHNSTNLDATVLVGNATTADPPNLLAIEWVTNAEFQAFDGQFGDVTGYAGGSNTGTEDAPSYLVLNYIIKT